MNARVKAITVLLFGGLLIAAMSSDLRAEDDATAPTEDERTGHQPGRKAKEDSADGTEGGLSQRVADLVIRLATEKASRLLTHGEHLDRAAAWAAKAALAGPVDRTLLRQELWNQGVRDFEFAPLSVVVRGLAPERVLRSLLDDATIPWHRLNALGVGIQEAGDRLAITILLSRRSAVFSDASGTVEAVHLGPNYLRPRLYATRPSGDVVERLAHRREAGHWEVDTGPGTGAGTWLMELVADGPRGPEVLALWPIEVQGKKRLPAAADPAAAWVVGAGPGPRRSPTKADVELAEDHLWDLINQTRESRGLVSLRRTTALTRAARTHAGDLGRGETFGHETSSGSVKERLEGEGVTVLRATENAAVAASVAQVHAALMGSPAHRSNLLDPEVSTGGVGVVLRRDRRGRWSAVVSEVFAALLPEGSAGKWREAILNRLNDRRHAADIQLLRRRERLDEVAEEACVEILARGTTEFSPEQRRAIADRARFHFLNVRHVGVDLLITPDPLAVDRLPHGIDPSYSELGIGLHRLDQPLGEHPAGSLVITLVFIER